MFLRISALLAAFFTVFVCLAGDKIDRRAVVERHNISYGYFNARRADSPSQVGNGKFAFAFDHTGLQTILPQNTLSDWGWHSTPPPANPDSFKGGSADSPRGKINFPLSMPDPNNPALSRWLEANPHRANLGRISFELFDDAGGRLGASAAKPNWQSVNMYTGAVESCFDAFGKSVRTTTVSHPERDIVAVRVNSDILPTGKLRIALQFPYCDERTANMSGDFGNLSAHSTNIVESDRENILLKRVLDGDSYFVKIKVSPDAEIRRGANSHSFEIVSAGKSLEFVCEFSPTAPTAPLPSFGQCRAAYEKMWGDFWQNGAFVDLSESSDPRWRELERRVICSQFLTRINCAGLLPPQESGLAENSWFGKFHFEMVWWHAYHWLLWSRPELADGILSVYANTLAYAREIAKKEGYNGARWPKCTANVPRESPHAIHAMLIWQQPHPIFFAEAKYRENPTKETLEKWSEIVFATAEFMADFPIRDAAGKYNLEPPMYIVSENTPPEKTRNPTFELSYWRYGLSVALEWQKRLGIPENKKWRAVLENLAELPQKDGLYEIYEGIKGDMWSQKNWEHPAIIGVYGMLRGDGADAAAARRTLEKIGKTWRFDKIWGWDFPMLAMSALRTGDPEKAIDYLLFAAPHYNWDNAGLVDSPCFYFPANGGLLAAVAMLANGWDGAPPPDPQSLYFPKGKWKVKAEGFKQKHQ